MLRKRFVFGGALVVSLALILGGLPGVARASTTVDVTLTINTDYSCLEPSCSATPFWTSDGIAHSKVFGAMTTSTVGSVSPGPGGCLYQVENWAVTTQKGKNTILFSTTSATSDLLCPTADPNILQETGTYTITGGTGLFSNATGSGTGSFVVPFHPQNNSRGTVNLTLTY
jgi:hypothetical protein